MVHTQLAANWFRFCFVHPRSGLREQLSCCGSGTRLRGAAEHGPRARPPPWPKHTTVLERARCRSGANQIHLPLNDPITRALEEPCSAFQGTDT